MEGVGLVLLGVVAVGTVTQASLLIAMALHARKLAQRVDALHGRLDKDIRPTIDEVQRISRNLAEVSELASAQARRVDALVSDAAVRVDEAKQHVRQALMLPAGPLGEIMAVFKALRRGMDVYRTLGSVEAEAQGETRNYREDEHLFI